MEALKSWEDSLIKRQDEWRKNFEQALSEHSFEGISHVVEESIVVGRNEDIL